MSKEVFTRITELDIKQYELVKKNDTMNTFIEKETKEKVALHITIKSAEVKYLPGRFDKLVVIPIESENIQKLEDAAREHFPVEKYLKEGSIGFKCSSEIKERLGDLKPRDHVDLCFTYNGVLLFNDKYYPSFTLQDFEKVKHAGKKKFIV